jgi:hypothetical protein
MRFVAIHELLKISDAQNILLCMRSELATTTRLAPPRGDDDSIFEDHADK